MIFLSIDVTLALTLSHTSSLILLILHDERAVKGGEMKKNITRRQFIKTAKDALWPFPAVTVWPPPITRCG
jgi:hypothetical protein